MNNVHSAREALVATLLADVDVLLRRVESLAPAMTAAGDKLTQDVRRAIAAHDGAAAEARASVGGFIVRQVNEATCQASAELRAQAQALQGEHADALRQALREALAQAQGLPARVPPRPPGLAWRWVALLVLASSAASAVITAWLLRA